MQGVAKKSQLGISTENTFLSELLYVCYFDSIVRCLPFTT